jgi:hypothetical protein
MFERSVYIVNMFLIQQTVVGTGGMLASHPLGKSVPFISQLYIWSASQIDSL